MIVLDRLLVGGLRFVFDKIASAVDSEIDNPERLKEELLAAQMRLELGEIDEDEFAAIERDVLARMRALREDADEAPGAISFAGDGARVDVSFGGDEPREE